MLVCLGMAILASTAVASDSPYRTLEYWELARSTGGNSLASLLSRAEPPIAARAALALGRTGKLLAADPLLQHTQAGDTAIRAMVAYGLGLLAVPLSGKTVDPMLAPLAAPRRVRAADAIASALDDGSPAVRVAALDATARFAAAHDFTVPQATLAFTRCAKILRGDESPVIRGRAAYALAYLGAGKELHGRALTVLENAFSTEDNDAARWHVMWALAATFAKYVDAGTLTAGLRDSSEVVQIQTLHALERRRDKAWIARVEPLTRDVRWRVNEEARETVRILRGGKHSEHLRSIPSGVVTPAPQPRNFSAGLAPLPRPRFSGKPSRPTVASLPLGPHIFPDTVQTIVGPARGPHPRVAIVTTKGTLVLVLYPEWAPETVANFLQLANRGFYDGNRWFRVVPDFVVQSGDRTETGNGDAGYRIPAEENPLEQDSGVISMGLDYDKNGPERDSAGSQFYITLSPQLHLDRDFTVFGRVESGFDVLGRIVESDRIIRIEQLPADERYSLLQ